MVFESIYLLLELLIFLLLFRGGVGSLKDMFQSSCKLNHCVLLFLEHDFCGSDWIQNFSSIDLCKDVDSLISFSCCRLYSSSKYFFLYLSFLTSIGSWRRPISPRRHRWIEAALGAESLGAAHGDPVVEAANLLQFKGLVAAHRPALAGAIDHFPAIGGGGSYRREGEEGLLGV